MFASSTLRGRAGEEKEEEGGKTCGRKEAKAWTKAEGELVARVSRTRHDIRHVTREMCTLQSTIANARPSWARPQFWPLPAGTASPHQSQKHAPSKWMCDPPRVPTDWKRHPFSDWWFDPDTMLPPMLDERVFACTSFEPGGTPIGSARSSRWTGTRSCRPMRRHPFSDWTLDPDCVGKYILPTPVFSHQSSEPDSADRRRTRQCRPTSRYPLLIGGSLRTTLLR